MSIIGFRGNNFYLSNFSMYPVKVYINGEYLEFTNSEAAFHAFKDQSRAKEFCNLTPSEAKKLGRKVTLRKDWETIKDKIMCYVLICKFAQNKDLLLKLQSTQGDLVEDNDWGDKYWGQVDGEGRNQLGKTLMYIRELPYDVIMSSQSDTKTAEIICWEV